MTTLKRRLKQVWEQIPYTPDLEWHLFRKHRLDERPWIQRLKQHTEMCLAQLPPEVDANGAGKKVFIFSMINTWIRYSINLGLTLSSLGHEVTLTYLPYENWSKEMNSFQKRLWDLHYRYAQEALQPHAEVRSLLEMPGTSLPPELKARIENLSRRDYQYTRQVEEVGADDPLFKLRMRRNRKAAEKFFAHLQEDRPDVVIVPNGLILEFGALFEVATYLGIDVVTYEFGEQRDKIWIAQNKPVMYQDTGDMWALYKDKEFSPQERERIEELFASRRSASLWQQFSRQWQQVPAEGRQAVRDKTGLDHRLVVLMAANVIGDSLTLGRQVFSDSMTEWIERTLEFFSHKPDIQFVLRIHPGERYTQGPSVADIVREKFPAIPDHFKIVAADDPVNTYDLIAAADLGLTYTTTVGMEMAMSRLPVIVSGNTHYRGKGFTLDPDSWESYFFLIERVISAPDAFRVSEEQYVLAWHYAYRFFFNYPMPCPWHLRAVHEMLEEEPINEVLSPSGMQKYGKTFDYLVGEIKDWSELAQ